VKPHEWEKIDGSDVIGPAVMFQWWNCKHCGTTARTAVGEELTEADVLLAGLSVDCDEQLVEGVHSN
jgi:hypothetical protein